MRSLDAADHEIDRSEALKRLHIDAASDHAQIATLHELKAKIAREIGVAEVILVAGPWRKQRDQRAVALDTAQKFSLQLFEITGKPYAAAGAEDIAHKLAVKQAVRECEPYPCRGLGMHVDDPPDPARVAHQIGGEEVNQMSTGLGIAASMQESRVAENEPRRHLAGFEKQLGAVKVFRDKIEEHRPLHETAFQMRPFPCGYDDGNKVDRPGLAASGLGKEIVRDAVLQDEAAQALLPLALLAGGERTETFRECCP